MRNCAPFAVTTSPLLMTLNGWLSNWLMPDRDAVDRFRRFCMRVCATSSPKNS